MPAKYDAFPGSQGPLRALEAGCSLLIYRTPARSREALADLRQDLKLRKLSPERVLESAARVNAERPMDRHQNEKTPPELIATKGFINCIYVFD